jgi:hypothetical protein
MVTEKLATVKQTREEAALTPRARHRPEFVVTPTRSQLYWVGFNAFCDGAKLNDIQDEAMRRGWWAALNAEAAAVTGYDKYMEW